jgi:carbamoyltransferase
MDVAASAQLVLEEALIHLARHLRAVSGQRRLCLAGGVALNCVANSRVIAEAGFDEAFIQPAAGDNGTSLGAALYVHHQLEGRPRRQVMETDALGPAFGDEEIQRELRENRIAFEVCDDIASATALRLASGDVVGWFQGRMEFGPRALGHRSILADPRRRDVKQVLDDRIKRREPFRPYAPAVLREAHADYFSGPGDSPFMIKNFSVRPEQRERIPAVVHVDGSARVQTVDRAHDPLFWSLIHAFERQTGVPLVLNTSFNGQGETIVCSVRDALRCFYSTGLDALAIGNCLVRKAAPAGS